LPVVDVFAAVALSEVRFFPKPDESRKAGEEDRKPQQQPTRRRDGRLPEQDQVGPRLVRRFLEHWDGGGVFEPFLTLWRSAAIQPQARQVLHDTIAGPVARRIAAEFGVTDAELRVELVASHLAGLAFARYQLKLEPIASTAVEDLVARVGPTVQRYLTGD